MWHQLLIVVLRRLAKSYKSKNEMISECHLQYSNDLIEQEKINKFDREYESLNAIW